LAGAEEREEGSGTTATVVGADEERVLAHDRDATEQPLGQAVVDRDPPVGEVARQRVVVTEEVLRGDDQKRRRMALGALSLGPVLQRLPAGSGARSEEHTCE